MQPACSKNGSTDEIRDALAAAYRMDESACVRQLAGSIPLSPEDKKSVAAQAATLVRVVRENRKRFGGLDSFLQEFGL